jgi:hypothetical protein
MPSTLQRIVPSPKNASRSLTAVALDEAFADLPELIARVDAAQPKLAKRNYVAETEQLVSKIGEQMQTLEAQRTRLVRLLGDLSISCDI